jgi:hypothetical protein
MNNKVYLVVTSIADDKNLILMKLAEGAKNNGINFIIIGDEKSPQNFDLKGCDFFSISKQELLKHSLTKILPKNHYSRKNIGYLEAIANGAEIIIETDDDNIPYQCFWDQRTRLKNATVLSGNGWVNVYRYFTEKNIWPRGYPLELIKESNDFTEKIHKVIAPIQQSLADGNPDVDAIYRFVGELPVKFDLSEENIAITDGIISPFNSQNTTWFSEAFPLLYLPSFCSFRMTDIYRSFVANRVSWEYKWPIIFTKSSVWQERNDHIILKDFEDEVHGYLNYNKIWNILIGLKLSEKQKDIFKNVAKCYEKLAAAGLMNNNELDLLDAWNNDLGKYYSKTL